MFHNPVFPSRGNPPRRKRSSEQTRADASRLAQSRSRSSKPSNTSAKSPTPLSLSSPSMFVKDDTHGVARQQRIRAPAVCAHPHRGAPPMRFPGMAYIALNRVATRSSNASPDDAFDAGSPAVVEGRLQLGLRRVPRTRPDAREARTEREPVGDNDARRGRRARSRRARRARAHRARRRWPSRRTRARIPNGRNARVAVRADVAASPPPRDDHRYDT